MQTLLLRKLEVQKKEDEKYLADLTAQIGLAEQKLKILQDAIEEASVTQRKNLQEYARQHDELENKLLQRQHDVENRERAADSREKSLEMLASEVGTRLHEAQSIVNLNKEREQVISEREMRFLAEYHSLLANKNTT